MTLEINSKILWYSKVLHTTTARPFVDWHEDAKLQQNLNHLLTRFIFISIAFFFGHDILVADEAAK